jgi:flagellar protein FliL
MADPTPNAAAEEGEAPPPKSRKKLIIIVAVVAAVVLIGGGVTAFLMLKGGGKDGKEAHAKVEHVEPIYVPLDPPFVVNFESNGLVRFLQVTVQVMTEDPLAAEMVKKHDPVIRNGLLMLFSGQTYDSLSTTAGKENLRQAALKDVRRAIAAGGGDGNKVKDLYFTSFVMQ